MNNIGIIIQARLGSTRLPMKMIKPFFEGQGVFEIITKKIKNEFPNNNILVATSDNFIDNGLENICKRLDVDCFRGSEKNVLDRFIKAAELYGFSKIIRVCADNPFLNMEGLKELVSVAKKSNADYISFQTSKSVPTITTHFGFWAELVSLKALKKVQNLTSGLLYQEHVTNYIYNNPELFNINMIRISNKIENNKSIRMTLDTIEDFLLLQEIYLENSEFNDSIEELISIVSQNTEWLNKMEIQILENQK